MSVEITMEFDEQDNPVLSVKGAKGKACKVLTADVERKLGSVTSEQHTPEYRQAEESHVRHSTNNR